MEEYKEELVRWAGLAEEEEEFFNEQNNKNLYV